MAANSEQSGMRCIGVKEPLTFDEKGVDQNVGGLIFSDQQAAQKDIEDQQVAPSLPRSGSRSCPQSCPLVVPLVDQQVAPLAVTCFHPPPRAGSQS